MLCLLDLTNQPINIIDKKLTRQETIENSIKNGMSDLFLGIGQGYWIMDDLTAQNETDKAPNKYLDG